MTLHIELGMLHWHSDLLRDAQLLRHLLPSDSSFDCFWARMGSPFRREALLGSLGTDKDTGLCLL